MSRGWRSLLLVGLLLWAAAAQAQDDLPGGELYQKLCSQCHGENGDGNGTAAPRLKPRPRDFTSGKFKIRHTPSGALPTDDDLRDVIREGMPYTSMPGWAHLSDAEINELIAAVKSFSPDFANPERKPEPLPVPKVPAITPESVEKGKEVYARIGCPACHGEVGRGDGTSAPTLQDDWGNPIRPADLTMRWTYRGGPTREDIYRTFTTGMNGTPMPSFADSLSDEERWQLVDYIYSLDPRDAPGYAELLRVQWTAEELDLARGAELFASAPPALFPVVGQITEPGRAFHPPATALTVRAVYNAREIAFRLTWHDLRADVRGRNAPDLPAPEEEAGAAGQEAPEGSFWGDEEAAAGADTGAAGEGGDFWGEEAAPAADAGEGDFWGDEGGAAAGAGAGGGSGFSDAVAIQLPSQMPSGIRKPYFIFGDAQNPVDLWFLDLATQAVQRYTGAGSKNLTVVEGEDVEAVASYDRGEWSVIMKRALRGSSSVSLAPGQYVPIAFSIWDGHEQERGNKRGLTQWMYLYTMPQESPSPVGPMLATALAVLAIEVLLVVWVRRRQARPGEREIGGREIDGPETSERGNQPTGEVQAHV